MLSAVVLLGNQLDCDIVNLGHKKQQLGEFLPDFFLRWEYFSLDP